MHTDRVLQRRAIAVAFSLLLLPASTSVASAGAATTDARLGDVVVPTFQAIELRLDARESEYRGRVRIELEARRQTDGFRFNSEGLEMRSLRLTGGAEIATVWEAESDEVVRVKTAEPLAAGSYVLEVEFANPFDTQAVSLYRMEQDGVGYVFSQFQADDAREAFPCWDEPAFKIPFQVTLTVPEEHLAVTNTPVESETTADGWRTTVFRKTRPLPSYLLAIATGPLETVPMPGLGIPGRIVTVRGQSHLAAHAARTTPAILKALEEYFGTPYPYAKLDFLALPEFWPGAMENPGAVTYADRLLLLDPATASVSQRRRQAGIIAHELAHMWFGDLVTMAWWDDLWLNESFATWMGNKIVDQVSPELDADVASVQSSQGILIQDARATTEPIRRPIESAKDVFGGLGLVYQKGRAVLAMFEQWLGPETFRRGVNAYLAAHAWGNATAADFWRSLDKASGKEVSAALATFIDQPGFPHIDVEILEGGRVALTQRRFRTHGAESPDFRWRVPVSLKYPVGDGTRSTTVLLVDGRETVSLSSGEAPPWIFPNAAASGYYRWSLPAEGLRYLAANAAAVLNPGERVELIGNVSALLAAGAIGGDDYLAVLAKLAGDPDPSVINTVLGALGGVRMALVSAEVEEPFAAWIRRTLRPALAGIGLERAAGEAETVSLARPRLLDWLGREGHDPEVLAAARTLARSYMEDPASVDPSVAEVGLRLAAVGGDRKLWEEYRRRFESAASPTARQRFLGALAAFGDAELRRASLAYALEGPLRPNEIFAISGGIGVDAAGRELTYRWLTERYDAIIERLPREFASFMPFAASGCSLERLESAKSFFVRPEHSVQGTDKQLAKVAEQVEECIQLREREGEAVARYLKSLAE